MRAMILAAGRGERLRPVTDAIPKALVDVGGECLIERHLRMLAASGVDFVVINLGWLGEEIVQRVGGGDRYGLQVVYSPEYENILDTAGGIQRALPMLGSEPFWVVNSDVYTDLELADVDVNDDSVAHLVLVATPAHKSSGDFDLANGRISRSASPAFTFSGMARYSPEFFIAIEPGRAPLGPELFKAADNNLLSGSLYKGLWADIGTIERLDELNRQLTP